MYDPRKADGVTKPKVVDVRIVKPFNLWKRETEPSPDAGLYQKVDEDFARNTRVVTI